MKFCMLLPTYLPNDYRRDLAVQSYSSLLHTRFEPSDAPMDLFVVYRGPEALQAVADAFVSADAWAAHAMEAPEYVTGSDWSICWCMEQIIEDQGDLTHMILLADDMVYNPKWFNETKALVLRHPQGLAWSTYRSAHTRHHRTKFVYEPSMDHSVTSLAGNGTCWTFDEWRVWGIKHTDPSWPVPEEMGGGNTIDLQHPYVRPGQRWATEKSYMQHIGVKGVHCHEGTPEFALEFVGE